MNDIFIKAALQPLFALRDASNDKTDECLDRFDAANGAKTVLRVIATSKNVDTESDLNLPIPVAADDFLDALHSIKDHQKDSSDAQLKLFLLLLDKVFTLNAESEEEAITQPLQVLREAFTEPLKTLSEMPGAKEVTEYFAERWGIKLPQPSESGQ